ncbi:MAG: hypothetical protein GF320_14225 [Armatimonadia bacterium]|nr:hypothetical protein [Armatimonadia bacterium]
MVGRSEEELRERTAGILEVGKAACDGSASQAAEQLEQWARHAIAIISEQRTLIDQQAAELESLRKMHPIEVGYSNPSQPITVRIVHVPVGEHGS